MPTPPDQPEMPGEDVAEAYLVEQYELHVSTYSAITANAAEAIAKVLDGEAEMVEDSTEYVEICDAFGLPVEGNEELAEQLTEMSVHVDEHMIPSIRSVRVANSTQSHVEAGIFDTFEQLLNCTELNRDDLEPGTTEAIARAQQVLSRIRPKQQ